MTEVVAALIWDGDKFMICQRPEGKARPLLWEFVGGKIEPGETMEEALVRECREELGVTLSVGDAFIDVVHEYPDITVHLTLFNAFIAEGIPQRLEHNDIRYITVDEIPQYAFCPADEDILKRLRKMKRYNKLVRDRIPDIIKASGKSCVTCTLSKKRYKAMLEEKLNEELSEYRESKSLEELADLMEVIYACAAANGHTIEELEAVRRKKAVERGGFEKRIFLREVFEE